MPTSIRRNSPRARSAVRFGRATAKTTERPEPVAGLLTAFPCCSSRPRAKPSPPFGWRGAGAVERGGLENRCPLCGGPRVRIPPSPPVYLIYVHIYNELVDTHRW